MIHSEKNQRQCALKLAGFFLLAVSDSLTRDKSSPDRACLLMPRDVLFAWTFLASGLLSPVFSSRTGPFPRALVGADPELLSWRGRPAVQSSLLHGQTRYWGAPSRLVG